MPVSARSSVVLPWSMWPAVPTTTVIAVRPFECRSRSPREPPASSRATVRRSRTTRPPSIGPRTHGVPRRRRRRCGRRSDVEGDAARRQGLAGERAASDGGPRARRRRHGHPVQWRGKRARRAPGARQGRRDHPPDRDGGLGPTCLIQRRASRRRRRASPCRVASRVRAGPGGSRHEVRAADDEPGLRPADQLVAAERDEVRNRQRGARPASARGRGRASRVGSSAPLPRSSTTIAPWRCARSATSRGVRHLDEAGCAEVRRVHPEDQPRAPIGQRLLEVCGARPIGGADLDQPCAGSPHDLRDAHAAADLDELARRHRHARRGRQAPPRARRAAALLFVTSASSAPVSATRCVLRGAEARPAAAGLAVELEQQVVERPHRAAARPRLRGHGARPRFVWTITPVALMTGTRPLAPGDRAESARRCSTAAARASSSGRVAWLAAAPRPRPLDLEDLARRGIAQRRWRRRAVDLARGPPRAPVRRSGAGDCRRSRAAIDPPGGSAWESNPPRDAERRATGFEDQGSHRAPTAPSSMVARRVPAAC